MTVPMPRNRHRGSVAMIRARHRYLSMGRGACPLLSPAHHHDDLKTACKQRARCLFGVWGNAPCKPQPRHSWSECGGPHGFRKYPVLLVARPGGDRAWLASIALRLVDDEGTHSRPKSRLGLCPLASRATECDSCQGAFPGVVKRGVSPPLLIGGVVWITPPFPIWRKARFNNSRYLLRLVALRLRYVFHSAQRTKNKTLI